MNYMTKRKTKSNTLILYLPFHLLKVVAIPGCLAGQAWKGLGPVF